MKTYIRNLSLVCLWLVVGARLAVSAPIPKSAAVMADTNGVLTAPLNFWIANAAAINAIITGGGGGGGGTNGNTILNGTINPTGGVGNNGDFYINTTAHTIFGPKALGSWPGGVSLVGPTGTTGATGATGPQGIQGIQGIQGVAGTNGLNGTNGATGATGATGPQGIQGIQGATGAAGANGNTLLSGTTAPSSGIGVNGDFYYDTVAKNFYGPKASGSWPSGVNIIGPTGATGATGAAGTNGNTVLHGSGAPSNGLGVNGDFYIDTAANTIYGPKASGVWASGVSLVGPTGATGPQGIQGIQGATGPQGPAGIISPLTSNVNGAGYSETNLNTVQATNLIGSATSATNLTGSILSAQISDATSANTVSVVMKRDGSGNFSAGTATLGGLAVNGFVGITNSGHGDTEDWTGLFGASASLDQAMNFGTTGVVSAQSFSGLGSALTALSAANLTGTAPNGTESPNTAKLNANNNFTGAGVFSSGLTFTNTLNQTGLVFTNNQVQSFSNNVLLAEFSAVGGFKSFGGVSNLVALGQYGNKLTGVTWSNVWNGDTNAIALWSMQTNIAVFGSNYAVFFGGNGVVSASMTNGAWTFGNAANAFTGSGAGLTAVPSASLTGTLPNGVFPATLPAASGANLTALNGTQITAGNVPSAAISNALLTLLRAGIGVSLTYTNGTNTITTNGLQSSDFYSALNLAGNGSAITGVAVANLTGVLSTNNIAANAPPMTGSFLRWVTGSTASWTTNITWDGTNLAIMTQSGTATNISLNTNGNGNFTGTVTAATFAGSGSGVTNLNGNWGSYATLLAASAVTNYTVNLSSTNNLFINATNDTCLATINGGPGMVRLYVKDVGPTNHLLLCSTNVQWVMGTNFWTGLQGTNWTLTLSNGLTALVEFFSDTNNNPAFTNILGKIQIQNYQTGGSSGSGTVTTISMPSDFAVANPTTTPAVTWNNQAANSIYGNGTGSSATPAASTNGDYIAHSFSAQTFTGNLFNGNGAGLTSLAPQKLRTDVQEWYDPFVQKPTASLVGNLSWNVAAVGSGASWTVTNGDSSHFSCIRPVCTASQGASEISMGDTPSFTFFSFPGLGKITGWTNKTSVQLGQTNAVFINVGFASTFNSETTNTEPQSWFGIRYNAGTDSTFVGVCRTNSVSTTNVLGNTIDTGWHTLTMYCSGTGMMTFQVDSTTAVQITNNVTTGSVNPFIYFGNVSLTAGYALVNNWRLVATGLNQ